MRLLLVIMLFVTISTVPALVLYDNGPHSGSQNGRNIAGPFTVFDNFILASDSVITGFTWLQSNNSGSSTVLTVKSGTSNPLTSGLVEFSQTKDFTVCCIRCVCCRSLCYRQNRAQAGKTRTASSATNR